MFTANGLPILEMRLTMPLSGLWVASLEILSDEPVQGAVALAQSDAPEVSYAGFAVRSGVVGGSCYLEVVGGAGGLAGDVEARSYQGVTARTVAGELLASVGEALDASSTRSAMATALPFWTRAAGRATVALSALASALGVRWRVQPAGAVWVGADAWPEAPDQQAMELDRDPRARTVLLGPDDLGLRPGLTLRGERVGRVEHFVSRSSALRTTCWLEDS